MAPTPEELEQLDFRRRVRDQVQMMRDAHEGDLATDLPDDADHTYLFVPGRVLLPSARLQELTQLVNDNLPIFEVAGQEVSNPIEGLTLFEFPRFRDPGRDSSDFLRALNFIDSRLGTRVVTPDHYLHVAAIGGGRPCPVKEPAETGITSPWPPATKEDGAGSGVKVTIVDTGGPPLEDPTAAQLAEIEELSEPLAHYSGHGTFIEGVVRCRAPGAEIKHRKFLVQGGAIQESEMVAKLQAALDEEGDGPHVINLSAGGHTRHGFELTSLQQLYDNTLSTMANTILVAAAGNYGTYDPFYPAAFDWALGVGSLDRDDRVSSFSNYGVSSDLFVVGRNHINVFPSGSYVCQEAPDTGDERLFANGFARWSGTSFAAPIVAGMIAARAQADNITVIEAAGLVRDEAADGSDAAHGPFQFIGSTTF